MATKITCRMSKYKQRRRGMDQDHRFNLVVICYPSNEIKYIETESHQGFFEWMNFGCYALHLRRTAYPKIYGREILKESN